MARGYQTDRQELKTLRLLMQLGACCDGAFVDVHNYDPVHVTVTVGPWDITAYDNNLTVCSGDDAVVYPIDDIVRIDTSRTTFTVVATGMPERCRVYQ